MRKAIWLAMAGLAAATATATAGTEKVRSTHHLRLTIPPGPHAFDDRAVPSPGVGGAVTGLVVPVPDVPPAVQIIVPERPFADARPYPLGMVLVAPPVATRTLMVVAVIETAPADDPTWPLVALLGSGAAALGFLTLRRRATGSLAHSIGTL